MIKDDEIVGWIGVMRTVDASVREWEGKARNPDIPNRTLAVGIRDAWIYVQTSLVKKITKLENDRGVSDE